MRSVATTPRSLADYEPFVGGERLAGLRSAGERARGLRVLHLNATAYGGGVAEILHNLVPLMRDVGLDASWSVIDAEPAFFDVTKKIHNALQGMPLGFSDEERRLFVDTQRANVARLPEADVIVAHDPQTAGLRAHAGARGARWIWRCHIDLTAAHPPYWAFLRPFVEQHDAAIFTMAEFVQPDLRLARTEIIAPSIDPTTPKNRELAPAEAAAVVARYGLDPFRPLLVQVSRFDPWKDPLGVIDAYRLAKDRLPDLQLAMIGSLADDDPEGAEYLARTIVHAGADPDIRCLTNLDGVGDVEVNAFQRAATVVVQKSLREGFGLVVSEALWKQVPVVGGACGGIPTQIVDGETGYL
ncbi:MAG: glycosyltransferase, partial [Candidatus Limnocylindria bacterium]